MNGPPTRARQAALLAELRSELAPLMLAERIANTFTLEPGTRLRRAYGRCSWPGNGATPMITVRCTADGDRHQWRRRGAVVGTLLHELAHLRYRSHGPRFWALHRRLVDRAAEQGVYDPTDRDSTERGRGDEKLALSAAHPLAIAARQARQERARLNRAALQGWRPGALGKVAPGAGKLAGTRVRVLALGRTRLLIEAADRRRYRVTPAALLPCESCL